MAQTYEFYFSKIKTKLRSSFLNALL